MSAADVNAVGGRAAGGRPRWDLVIFDCDGVLVDSEPIANRVFAELLGEVGLPLSYDETIATFLGRSMAACVAIIEARLGRPVPAEFAATCQARVAAAFARELAPVPGVVAALDGVAALGLPACVASSGTHEKIRASLGVTGLLPRFTGRIYSATEVARGKPFPDLFLHAARALGARPARCVVVEDTALGVQAAVAAGMTALGYAPPGARSGLADPEALARSGARVFASMDALCALLAEGPQR